MRHWIYGWLINSIKTGVLVFRTLTNFVYIVLKTDFAIEDYLLYYMNFWLYFAIEDYLLHYMNFSLFTQLRFGVLKLNIETGRYFRQNRMDRICNCCNMQCVENEYHFVLVCPAYRQIRLKYFSRYYCSWPNVDKLYRLLKTKSRRILCNIICYLRESWK